MESFEFWVKWLKSVKIVFALFGIIIAFFNQTWVFNIALNNWINPVFWDSTQPLMEAVAFQKWIYGLLGATCFMVGILMYFIVKNAYSKKERWAWNCLSFGLVS